MKTIHLVLAYHGAVFVDSAWSTAEAAEERAKAIADSRKALKAYVQDGIKVLAVRLDESGTAVQFQIPEPVSDLPDQASDDGQGDEAIDPL